MAKVLESISTSGEHRGWSIFCPACGHAHFFDKRWGFNGDVHKPTFNPSMLVKTGRYPSGGEWPTEDEIERLKKGETLKMTPSICHSFVRDGMIEFLGDCTHSSKGQTVVLQEWEETENAGT